MLVFVNFWEKYSNVVEKCCIVCYCIENDPLRQFQKAKRSQMAIFMNKWRLVNKDPPKIAKTGEMQQQRNNENPPFLNLKLVNGLFSEDKSDICVDEDLPQVSWTFKLKLKFQYQPTIGGGK